MIQTLTIVGPGVLGRSLASWAAQCGLDVRLVGRDVGHGEAGCQQVVAMLQREAQRGELTEKALAAATARLHPVGGLVDALAGCDVLLEALPEQLELKAAFWRELPATGPLTLCLTGSSALPLAALQVAAAGARPHLGFHLFVPVGRMAVVELVTPAAASSEAISKAEALAQILGLKVAKVQDQPGYAAARMALAQGLEAMRLVEAGIASPADLDTLMVQGYGHPVGPLELSDRIGLGLRLAIADQIFEATGDPVFEAPALLRGHVAAGRLGRASGQGFYRWTPKREDP